MTTSATTTRTHCPLCNGTGSLFYNSNHHEYFQCSVCEALYIAPDNQLSSQKEKERYLEHSGEISDGYRNFVKPLIEKIASENSSSAKGLDLGAGHTAIAALMLTELGFTMEKSDPYFFPDKSIFKKKYDFIVSCEVIEHFSNPKQEFETIHKLLKPGGKLYCKTDFYNSDVKFANWYYKNDPTHVFIYTHKAIHWIKDNLNFSNALIDGRIIVLTK